MDEVVSMDLWDLMPKFVQSTKSILSNTSI